MPTTAASVAPIPLADFLRDAAQRDKLTLRGRLTIVRQAILLLQSLYAHLPLKRTTHGIDPVQRLRNMSVRLANAVAASDAGSDVAEPLPSRLEFHCAMLKIFATVCDVHTRYGLPEPYASNVAVLPFVIEECQDETGPQYVISRLMVGEAGQQCGLQPKMIVTHWNGRPIDKEIRRLAESQVGNNETARRAQALDSLTIRPLRVMPPPDEDWVELRVRNGSDPNDYGSDPNDFRVTLTWQVVPLDGLDKLLGARTEFMPRGLDVLTEFIRLTKIDRFQSPYSPWTMHVAPRTVDPPFDETLRVGTFRRGTEELGYLRIFSFDVRHADVFVDTVATLVQQLPQAGLVVDIRGNTGGSIDAAERLLQVLVSREIDIDPEPAEFLATPLTLEYARRSAPPPVGSDPEFDLTPWFESLPSALESGASHSRGFVLTLKERCNNVASDQRYKGPVVLLVDALAISAADMFAAGFQDHEIGKVVGTANATGGAGAEVVSHGDVVDHFSTTGDGATDVDGQRIAPLPPGIGMSVALRRTLRVRAKAGVVLEGLGVKPDYERALTCTDIFEGNIDLIRYAATLLG